MRPKSIRQFDFLFLSSLALGLVEPIVAYDELQAELSPDAALLGLGELYLPLVLVASLTINLLLWFFVSRRASRIAKWILVAFAGVGLLTSLAVLPSSPDLPMAVSLLATVMNLAAIVMLFRADAREWLGSKGAPAVDPATFE